jgi:23S rRNA (adenine2030-N6)-methyltransferase
MNYRHAFHAGNFADVMKHAVLARILTYLAEKPAPYRVIDTHAGAGVYDLAGPEAARTGEWRDGIGRLRAASLDDETRVLLTPYLDAVASFNTGDKLEKYPGSPAIARAMMRSQDRLVACELEPQASVALARSLGRDPRAKAIAIDGWTALTAYIPPKERRGLVLIDPPFEQPDEFSKLANGLEAAHRKWSTGIFMLWYPIKDDDAVNAFVRKLTRARIAKSLRLELHLATAKDENPGLRGSGLIVVNPPWTLYDEMTMLLPRLAKVLTRNDKTAATVEWLATEVSR